ncbi:c-type cytochrome [soil metagenome]
MRAVVHRALLTAAAALSLVARVPGAQAPYVAGDTALLSRVRWAFPGASADLPGAKAPFDSVTPLHLPKSARTFTMAQAKNVNAPPDWYPRTHPPMPTSVAHGHAGRVWACGYCHLPDGQGRAENAVLAGLPAAYIERQVAAIRAGTRGGAVTGYSPSVHMRDVADSATTREVGEAARYFSRMRAKPRFAVVERRVIPAMYEAGGLYSARAGAESQPLGQRIIELADDLERHELRDARATFTAYVPVGSVAAGRRIAHGKATAPTTCTTCHGPALRGLALAPPIAGRGATYLFRQLIGFKTGARGGAASAPMQKVVEGLSVDDMIAVAAYAGSLRPSR